MFYALLLQVNDYPMPQFLYWVCRQDVLCPAIASCQYIWLKGCKTHWVGPLLQLSPWWADWAKLDSVLLSGLELKCPVPFWWYHFKGGTSLSCYGRCSSLPSLSVSVPGSTFIWPLCFQGKFVHLGKKCMWAVWGKDCSHSMELIGFFLLHHCMQAVPIWRLQST
jgi:hypothetical protein